MKEIQTIINSEEKSTAGNKHETSRAMMHMEREKFAKQLAESYEQKLVLEEIALVENHKLIRLASYIESSMGNFFIAIAAGKFNDVFTISMHSPIAQSLLHKKAGDSFEFRGKKHDIFCVD